MLDAAESQAAFAAAWTASTSISMSTLLPTTMPPASMAMFHLRTEVGPVDRSTRPEAAAIVSPWVLGVAAVLRFQHYLAGRAMDGQVAEDAQVPAAEVVDPGAAEGQGGKLLGIEEVGRSQVRVALLVAGDDARRIDGHLDARARQLLRTS